MIHDPLFRVGLLTAILVGVLGYAYISERWG